MSDRVTEAARKVVMTSTPFHSAWEMGHFADGVELHDELREALGISLEEWQESPDR